MALKRSLFDLEFDQLMNNRQGRVEIDPNQQFIDKIKGVASDNLITPTGLGREINAWHVTPIEGAKGQHSQIFAIDEGQIPLYDGVENAQLVFKTFHLERAKVSDRPEREVFDFIKNSLTQYRALRNEQFPTAEIYNSETVLQDGGYIVQKVTPLLNSERVNDPEVHQAVLELFLRAGNRPDSIAVDLSPGNVGFNEDGKLILFDYMEYDEGWSNAFLPRLRMHLDQFHQQCGGEFYNFLLEGIRNASDQRLQNHLDLCKKTDNNIGNNKQPRIT